MARHDESELTIINDRNIHSLHQALKMQRDQIEALKQQLEAQNRAVVTLRGEFTQMRESFIQMLTARL